MLAVERRDRILEILKDARFVSVNDLHDDLQVSRETIRRDINQLADEKRLIKTHGGAHSISRAEPAFADRMAANLPAKRAIGNRAADLVPDNATVMIDSGTTCIFTAEALMERRGLTVITNDIHVAGKLADRNDNRVLMLGGELVNGESATMGRDATAMLENYFADFSFIGISSLSDEGDLCDYTREAAALRGELEAFKDSVVGVRLVIESFDPREDEGFTFGEESPNHRQQKDRPAATTIEHPLLRHVQARCELAQKQPPITYKPNTRSARFGTWRAS